MVIQDGQLTMKGPFDAHQDSGGQFSLENAARVWTLLWRILLALGVDLTALTPSCSSPVRVSFKHGRGSSTADQTSNPRFYEKVMGWPTDWTAPELPATEYPAWLRLSRGRLSELLTTAASAPTEEAVTPCLGVD